jgi:DNA-binding transcriptional regulator/RsmH inhibitor MraZ
MALPFFQGNIQNLMDIAGPGQGSFLLGQLMRHQQEQEKANLQSTNLQNQMREMEMQQSREKHPYVMQDLGVNISNKIRAGEGMDIQNQRQQFGLDVDKEVGVPKAAEGKKLDIDKNRIEIQQKFRDYVEKSLLGMEWNPSIRDQLMSFATETQMPQGHAANMFSAAESKETWDAFRDTIFKNSLKAREKKLQSELDTQRQMIIEAERTSRALAVAKAKAEQAKRSLSGNNLDEALKYYMEAEFLAIQAGDSSLAAIYNAESTRIKQQIVEINNAKAGARNAGNLDPSQIGKGLPTRPAPQAQPVPSADPQIPQQTQQNTGRIRRFNPATGRIE